MLTPRFASSDAETPSDDSAILDAYSGAVIGALALDGQPVDGIDDLQRLLDARRIGRSCELKLLRRAAMLSLSVQPIELPARDA